MSIVTVALNAASALPLTLESIAAQDHDDLQVIVVDGGSWDATATVLDTYADVIDRHVVRSDAGIYYAMNDALAEVAKEYVIFMNAGDNFYCADAISRMVRGLTGTPDIFYGNHVYVAGQLDVLKRSASFDLIAGQLATGAIDGVWQESIPGHQATFCRADLLRTLRFDTRLKVCADHDLLFRAYDQGASMLYVDEVVAHYYGGGFSMQMGERTRLECAATYRRFSDRPEAVDRYFFPQGAPFPRHTARTGLRLAGLVPADRIRTDYGDQGDWVIADGGELLSPDHATGGIELSGHNGIADQRADVLVDGTVVGSADLPRGDYRVEIDFADAVPARSLVTVRPLHHAPPGEHDAALGFLLRRFEFHAAGSARDVGLLVGESLPFRHDMQMRLLPMLGTGWAQPEDSHVWSIGAQSDLWIKASADAGTLRFDMGGNPHVPDGRQPIVLRVNGETVASAESDHGAPVMLEIDCTRAPWAAGRINRVTIAPEVVAQPPVETGDTRLLGVCLRRLDVAGRR
ncbi:glycosyltransferase [Sphingomonas arantia]|uniref:Glycosyltransferase n=1 Tax=Sphingomonas arantia TaxID=1460676 RepID=A0ABW4U0C5_9SPHN